MITTQQGRFEAEFERIIDAAELDAVYSRGWANTGTLRAMSRTGFDTRAAIAFQFADSYASLHFNEGAVDQVHFYHLTYDDAPRIRQMFDTLKRILAECHDQQEVERAAR